VREHELMVTPSIGIAMFPDDGRDLDTLAQYADAAMYRAKLDGRNAYRFYSSDMHAQAARTLLLEGALRRALERAQLALHYQPQGRLQDGCVVGVEALLRWQHPELGMVSPAEFIPIAEKSGLILPIGEWVLRTAVQQLARWQASGLPQMTMAVNVSAVQFRHPNLPGLVSRILAEEGVSPACLELELTEGVASNDPERAIAIMADLRARGVRMSIDDFGTGYSSLSYLKRFQVYKLKIDKSFVQDITVDAEDLAIVHAIISLASSLGLHTIAEGVETQEQLDVLRAKGCGEIQGYFFSKPLPAQECEQFLRAHRPAAVLPVA
jgi:EAL domain-containing protein (putative c-di-GMP-specific phosphodiesterase class I)